MAQENLQVQVHACSTQYESLINRLTQQVEAEVKNAKPTGSTTELSAPDLPMFEKTLQEIHQMELKLKDVLLEVAKHEQVNSNINLLQDHMERKRKEHRLNVKSLYEKIEGFSALLQNSKHLLSSNKHNQDSSIVPVDVKELLLYSARVAKHTLSALTPPIPQEDQIRSSRLFEMGDKLPTITADQENGTGTEHDDNMNVIKIDMGLDETGGASSSAQDGSVDVNDDSVEDLLDLF